MQIVCKLFIFIKFKEKRFIMFSKKYSLLVCKPQKRLAAMIDYSSLLGTKLMFSSFTLLKYDSQ